MNAIVWHGGSDLRLESLPAPAAERDQVVLDVALAGVCGSDLHPIRGESGPRRPPLILGHEVVGTLQDGGQRYVVFPLVTCGVCPACRRGEENLCRTRGLLGLDRPGVFAEQVAVRRDSLIAIPDGLEDQLAVLTEPLATSVSTLRVDGLGRGDRIGVLGCGPIGLLAIHAARHAGLEVVAVEPLSARRRHALAAGAQEVHAELSALEGRELDGIIDAVGVSDTTAAGIAAVRRGATVAVLGLGAEQGTIPLAQIVRDGVRVRGHYAYTREDFQAALGLLSEDPPDAGWLSFVALGDTAAGIRELIEHPERNTKVILEVDRRSSSSGTQ